MVIGVDGVTAPSAGSSTAGTTAASHSPGPKPADEILAKAIRKETSLTHHLPDWLALGVLEREHKVPLLLERDRGGTIVDCLDGTQLPEP